MSIIKHLSRVYNALIGHFPLTHSQKENYLKIILSKVSYYQPLIESRTNVKLGDIGIREFKFSVDDQYYEWHQRNNLSHILMKPFYELKRMYAGDQTILATSPKNSINNILYVPFGDATKSKIYSQRIAGPNNLGIDESVVHELSHILFRRLEGRRMKKRCKKELCESCAEWNEGFATYCEKVFFSDIYPTGYIINQNLSEKPDIYQKGMNKIEKIIGIKGKSALLEIPKRWPEFEKELNNYKL